MNHAFNTVIKTSWEDKVKSLKMSRIKKIAVILMIALSFNRSNVKALLRRDNYRASTNMVIECYKTCYEIMNEIWSGIASERVSIEYYINKLKVTQNLP